MSFPAWIKIEVTTPDKPEVIAMAARLRIKDPDTVTGKLIRLWVWADANSIDGHAISITRSFVDRLTGCRGFAAAMEAVGWLEGTDGMVTFPGFERHNGDSAKRRATEARRKQKTRGGGKRPHEDGTNVPPKSGQKPDERPAKAGKKAGQNADLEEEIEIEEEKDNPPKAPKGAAGELSPFLETVWNAGPPNTRLRSSKVQLRKAWAATKPQPAAETLLAALKAWTACEAWRKDSGQYAPAIHRWIQFRQWENLPTSAGANDDLLLELGGRAGCLNP